MQDLILTGPTLPSALEALEANFKVHKMWEAADREAFLKAHGKTRFMAATYHGRVDAALMDKLPGLEIVANFGVGVDGIER